MTSGMCLSRRVQCHVYSLKKGSSPFKNSLVRTLQEVSKYIAENCYSATVLLVARFLLTVEFTADWSSAVFVSVVASHYLVNLHAVISVRNS